eukprot:CAMPEP_0201574152 /NCGR_PEP_ID=MMETSP0190_2-20130828/18438_1 /ASSEMBLY_ACC=CAM_ASM_000263 /TAXON_ID=37353 /ORGANISM="Rosalina sp." /LENGTH=407 /DNA_ID=CAMNT_0048001989 /DNA_START=15 /DNA_END=1238 /DNA_ORIENTATION=-
MSTNKSLTKRKLKMIGIGTTSVLLLGGLYYYYQSNNSNDGGCCGSNAKNTKIEEKTSSSCCGSASSKPQPKSSCCGSSSNDESKEDSTKSVINKRYSNTAKNFELQSKEEQEKLRAVAKVFGYSPSELEEIGNDANLGLGCGNPVKQANLKKGETVLDLGAGAGMDLFLARKYIGTSSDGGQLLGIDFSKDMVERAKKNASKKAKRGQDVSNVQFHHAEIEKMTPIKDNSVDCAISNCVLNLVPNKYNAFKEVHRVIKPGGRIVFSDIALKKALPTYLKTDLTSIVNCVGGACLATEYEQALLKAGFKSVKMIDKNVDLNVWKDSWESMVNPDNKKDENAMGCCGVSQDKACCGPSVEKEKEKEESSCCGAPSDTKDTKDAASRLYTEFKDMNLNDYVASYYVFGVK